MPLLFRHENRPAKLTFFFVNLANKHCISIYANIKVKTDMNLDLMQPGGHRCKNIRPVALRHRLSTGLLNYL